MLIRILKSKKGSTLVLVLVTLSILSILGTAIISLSVINFKMKIVDKNAKTSFYLAEAGLEEAYAFIGKEIENAIEAGNEDVKNKLPDFIDKERRKEQDSPEDKRPDDSIFIDGNSSYGEVNQENIEKVIEEWFRLGFASYLNKNLEDNLANHAYGTVDEDIDEGNAGIKIEKDSEDNKFSIPEHSIKIDSLSGKVTNVVDMDKNYTITLLSEFTHKNITKQVRGKFTIKIPPYNAPYYVKCNKGELAENILWKKALTTEKNLYITGNDVTINGDVYAYGTIPKDLKESRKFGGIVVGSDKIGSKNGKATINGNVATHSYVHTNYNNSSLNIRGDVYCNSLVTQEGTKDTFIVIEDANNHSFSVYTEDDIELNGKESKIEINGNYYGFSDGSDEGRVATHDKSSSIVINSEDIKYNSGSSLKITGDAFIAGTVYINLKDRNYQTGESVSVKGNYKAYGEKLNNISDDPSTLEYDESRCNNVEFGSYPPLILVDKFIDDEKRTTMTAIDKSMYFSCFSQQEEGKNSLNLGTNSSIDIRNVEFSTGAYINNGKVNISRLDLDKLSTINKKRNEYKRHVNNMSEDEKRKLDINKKVYINDKHNNGRFSFEKKLDSVDEIAIDEGNTIKKIVYTNDNSNKDLYILGDGVTNSESTINSKVISGRNIEGIIITSGDVHLRGDLNFRGTIAAEGDIYIEDNNPKTITNDLNLIHRVVYENKDLEKQFVNNGETFTFLYESEAGVADGTISYLKYDNIVDINWERVK